MLRSRRHIFCIFAILALFLGAFVPMRVTHAESSNTMSSVTPSSITSYSFSANPGDSLSRIIRRALQLRAVTDQPSAMYCENIISTQLGGEYIEVSQIVTVSFQQIDDCTAAAKNLDQDQRTAWQAYADTVDFNVSDISPTNNSSNVVAPQAPAAPSQPDQPTPSPAPAEPAPAPKPTQPTAPVSQSKKRASQPKKVSGATWLVVGSILTVVAYFAGESFAERRARR
ncbi:MAG: hypothetical protein JWO47_643 [Candidatus Saccharibacteria bacterium]|nr:hypothetical protein [Candidatus Saccharibacteria bacterium]